MIKVFGFIFAYFCSMAVFLFIIKMHRILDTSKTFDKIFSSPNHPKLFYRDLLFFLIAFLLFICISVSALVLPALEDLFGRFAIIESGLVLNILVILSGVITRIIYKIISKIVNKVFRKNLLSHIGENSRTWAFIMVSLSYVAMGLMKIGDHDVELIGLTALLIILGRLFWIDFTKTQVKKVFKGFFSLPYCITLFYGLIISATIVAPVVRFVGIMLSQVGLCLGILSAYLVTGYQYKQEFIKFFKDIISKCD